MDGCKDRHLNSLMIYIDCRITTNVCSSFIVFLIRFVGGTVFLITHSKKKKHGYACHLLLHVFLSDGGGVNGCDCQVD